MKIVQPKDTGFSQDVIAFSSKINVFMGGGMGNTEWHDIFINRLKSYNISNILAVFNPYNPNIQDKFDQIRWEHECLNISKNEDKHFIGSLYFDEYTNQPMSCLELGRMAIESKNREISVYVDSKRTKIMVNYGYPLIVTVNQNSPIKTEILYQCRMLDIPCQTGTPEFHADRVYQEYRKIKQHYI